MTRLISAAAVAALTALAASCAPTPDSGMDGDSASARPERQCFSADQVRNFRQGRSGQLYVRVTRNDVYELNSSGGCTDLDFAQRLAITADGAALSGGRLCTGDWARITLPGSAAPVSTCRARVDRVLSAEEVAALPSAHRP
ncbi:DUF6491 family protein [Brevundimonas sp.]|uniref:DUF6491 family protein n=1 Tax=Brevundimonas sp. TaxID=1871086 RepID=UPI002D33699D|nr:DUF6491 family protein [Brevundimonas sp.]HYC75959.1 DUF6491 family protein [Brevundimonas sp.]